MDNLEEKRAHYPRVSEIISKQNSEELRSVPLEALANACIRGQKVHDYCTAWVKHLWVIDIEPEYEPYFKAFTDWACENIFEGLYAGIRLYDDERGFTGEFDLLAKMKDGKTALLDIKTSASKSKAWPVQLAAYSHLCKLNGYEFEEIYNIHLKKTHAAIYTEVEGMKILVSPPVIKTISISYDDLNPYWEIFSSALKCYDYFDRKEVK
jgi:hypothetical protein